MNIKIITGLSGAGKSTVIKKFEDIGYYCIDNLPPALIKSFLFLCENSTTPIYNVAIGIDARGGSFFDEESHHLLDLLQTNSKAEVIFLEANEDQLIERFKETRRSHPLDPRGPLIDAIRVEKEKMSFLKARATYVVDTSEMNTRKLAKYIGSRFNLENNKSNMLLVFQSFGFKHGIPRDSDLVFDVRFLLNPYYISSMREKTGLDKEVADYVLGTEDAIEFVSRIKALLDYLIPKYKDEDKSQLVISIGCTGGRHRSVAISHDLKKYYENKSKDSIEMHRDLK